MDQPELEFSQGGADGLQAWYDHREEGRRQLSRNIGLPIGSTVELELISGEILKGRLLLKENLLWIDTERRLDTELIIGRCTFRVREIARCIKL